MTTFTEPAPHVFVIKGDVRNLACDAYMFATDKRLRSTGRWREAAPDIESRLDSDIRRAYQAEERFTLPVSARSSEAPEPIPILTAVPYYGVRKATDIVPRVREFFDVAAALVARTQHTRSLYGRPLPLVAVPLFGIGGGGGGPFRGDIFRVLYDMCREAAMRHGYDVVVVLRDERDYDLAQAIRREEGGCWDALTQERLDDAQRLAREAAEDRLVPFMGAGISISAGAPRWSELIQTLADDVGLDPETAADLAKNHDVLDQAAYLHREYDRRVPDRPDAFGNGVIRAVDRPRYGLAPAMLASLRSEQAITLNYDELFEEAASDAGLPRRVIPSNDSEPERWLLKLHGTVADPSSIILTREDYLGFAADRTALSSLVKATLMTRRLLFAGFGVSDPHFHEIVHDVRRALPEHDGTFGTVLTLDDSPTTRRLWQGELDFIVLPSPRLHDIFLDALLAHAASTHSYLLADGYASTLPPEDAALRQSLADFVARLDPIARESAAWKSVEARLRELGYGIGTRDGLPPSRAGGGRSA